MDVTIHQSVDDEDQYMIEIGDKATIETMYLPADSWRSKAIDTFVKDWVREMNKLYSNKKKPLIVGLIPDRSTHYANGRSYLYNINKLKPADYPYELIQLCIGSHCLLYDLPRYDPPAKAIRDLLSDHRTVVVGIGMESLKKRLEEDNKWSIRKAVDLRVLAEKDKGLGKCDNSLDKLSKVVLGEEWGGVVRPRSMNWWGGGDRYPRRLSHDKIKFGTLDAFLAYEIGVKLLKDDNQVLDD